MTKLDPSVICKCGKAIDSVEAGKVHYLVMSIMPWLHVKKS